MQPDDVVAERLLRHRLDGVPLDAPEAVVAWLAGAQAQEYPVARWSLGTRAAGLVEGDVDRALADGRIVRTHVLRDTWHLVARGDLRWMVELTRARIHRRNGTMHRRLGLAPDLPARTDALLAEAVAGGARRTREELAAVLAAAGVPDPSGMRLAYFLMHAELELVLCSGGLDGRRQTYAAVAGRVPEEAPRGGDDALAELARRYLAGHGPATARDLAWWASLTLGDARRAYELLGDAVRTDTVGDRTYRSLRAAPPAQRADPARAHLLQGYDEYVVAYTESRDVLDRDGLAAVVPGGAAMFTHAILLDGQVIGHWRRRPSARRMRIEVQLARPLEPDEREALDDAVQRYAAFAGLPATWG